MWNTWRQLVTGVQANSAALARIEAKLGTILTQEKKFMADTSQQLAQLQADVAANTTVEQSAITLIQGLKAALDAAGTDPAALTALSQSLEASTKALSDAIAANTSSATTQPPAG